MSAKPSTAALEGAIFREIQQGRRAPRSIVAALVKNSDIISPYIAIAEQLVRNAANDLCRRELLTIFEASRRKTLFFAERASAGERG